ncbi:DMT family transporter [uncultured Desulfosarcina sp.]|uniref:DMT family transporter n=1 Tax=uncultured Desulfosarcina sp. TaxID=218289 RepID=UPI0029C75F93|nr:DMT family transporter [uncultured Desulfosarcina sp.]
MRSKNTTLDTGGIPTRPSGPPHVNAVMGVREWGLILILSVIWGGSFFFVGVAVKEMTPLTIVLCRVGFASMILLTVVRLTGRKIPTSAGVWGSFFVLGALNNLIPFSLIVWGQTHIDSSLAAILNATTPIFSVVLAHLLTREERLTANRMAGVLVGWVGVAVLIGIESLGGFGIQVLGQLAVVVASLSYACAAIYGRRFKAMDPVVVSAGMLCGSTVMMLPMALIVEQPWHLAPGAATWAALFGLSAVSTSLAYIIYFRVLAVAGATNILLVTFLIPASAIFLGVMVLGERPGWNAFAGMALIFLGLIAIDGRLVKGFRWQKNK